MSTAGSAACGGCARRPRRFARAERGVGRLRRPWAHNRDRLRRFTRSTREPAMSSTRTETDSFGPIDVPADALWAAQTERSRRYFAIGEQRMPLAIVHALAEIKRAAAEVNL